MAVFRIEKTCDYTVMSNHHLRDKSLSLKAKGLLSLMLSLPEEWDYTTKGLARICKDGVDSICAGVRELEEHGYVIRQRVRNPNGQLGAIEYTILEQPRPLDRENLNGKIQSWMILNRLTLSWKDLDREIPHDQILIDQVKKNQRSIKYGRFKPCPILPQSIQGFGRDGTGCGRTPPMSATSRNTCWPPCITPRPPSAAATPPW